MNLKEAIITFYSQNKERTAGRYWASDIYSIRKGYLTAHNFFKPKKLNELSQFQIFWGQAGECWLRKILGKLHIKSGRQKEVLKINDWELSAECDFDCGDYIIEAKTPKDPDCDKTKWLDQLEAYHRIFKKPLKLVVLNRFDPPLYKVYDYQPSEGRWLEIQKLLDNFNGELKRNNWKTH